jgi:6-phosphofructokinase 1
MGRSAGWLSYGAAIAGEASLVISVEDIHGKYRDRVFPCLRCGRAS